MKGILGIGLVQRFILSVAGIAFVSVFAGAIEDYYRQSVYAGVPASEFGLSGWTQSFVDRGKAAAQVARLEARRDGPLRDYFPEAPTGWDRIEWSRDLEKAIMEAPGSRRDGSDPGTQVMAELESNPQYRVLKALDTAVGTGREYARSKKAYAYMRGSQGIILKARFISTAPAGRSGFMSAVSNGIDGEYGRKMRLVQAYSGVAFKERANSSSRRKPYRKLTAMIGKQLEITVLTNADMQDVDQVLAKLNYKALRKLVEADAGAVQAASRQRELSAELRRQEQEAKRKERDELNRIEKRLERMARSHINKNKSEVCLTHKGKRYCRWVEAQKQ